MKKEYAVIDPEIETLRGYVMHIDAALNASGSFGLPLLAIARLSGADIDKEVEDKKAFEQALADIAAEYGGELIVHNTLPDKTVEFEFSEDTHEH